MICLEQKYYELSNHLGNVMVTVSDKRLGVDDGTGKVDYYLADVTSATDCYPFGSTMPGRTFNKNSHRYNFQGQEAEEELWGGEASFFKYRISDNRLGRFFSVDPLTSKYPWNSSYAFSENRVIASIELEGLEAVDLNISPEVKELDLSFTAFIQYEYRVNALVLTHSGAIGIALSVNTSNIMNTQAGVFVTATVGPALAMGANTSWTAGVNSADNLDEFAGASANGGIYATASAGAGFAGGIEVNVPISGDEKGDVKDVNMGFSVPLPVQFGTIGAAGGVYAEGGYTWVLAEGSLQEMYDYVSQELLNKDIDVNSIGLTFDIFKNSLEESLQKIIDVYEQLNVESTKTEDNE